MSQNILLGNVPVGQKFIFADDENKSKPDIWKVDDQTFDPDYTFFHSGLLDGYKHKSSPVIMVTDTPQPEPEPEDTYTILAGKKKDIITGTTWLEFDGKPDAEMRKALMSLHWGYSEVREQWYNRRRYPDYPKGIKVQDDGECDYSSERADRMERAAAKARMEASRRLKTADSMASGIPLGQPMMPDHYTYDRDARYRKRIHTNYQKSFEAQDRADDLAYKANASRRYQERRRKKIQTQTEVKPEQKPAKPDLTGDIKTESLDIKDIHVGDIILYRGRPMLVRKINKVTVNADLLNPHENLPSCLWKDQKCQLRFISGKLTPQEAGQLIT